MEELRSTEVLDREIRADGVKKAERILAKAEESAKSLAALVEERVEKAKAEAEEKSRTSLATYEKNINAALPLEKARFLVSYIYDSLIEAMNSYFDSIGERGRLLVIKSLVENCKGILDGRKADALVLGFKSEDAEKMLKEVLGNSAVGKCENGKEFLFEKDAVKGFKRHEGILLKTQDGKISFRFTLEEKVKKILDEKSCDLAKTLFCGRIPE